MQVWGSNLFLCSCLEWKILICFQVWMEGWYGSSTLTWEMTSAHCCKIRWATGLPFLCFILWTSKVTLKLTLTCVWCFPLKPPTSFPSLHNHRVNSHLICREYLWTAEASVYTIPVTLLYRTAFLFMWIKWLHFQDFIRLFWFRIFCLFVMPWQIICVGVPLWKVNSVSGVQTAQKHRPLVVRSLPREGWELLVQWNTWLEVGDSWPNAFYNSCTLMAKDDREESFLLRIGSIDVSRTHTHGDYLRSKTD